MECNKDDAIKAKELAEKKFYARDMISAKKFALKAHALYPELEGISQMLATLDVYVSAENQIYGEADWYGVLGVIPQADEDTIRKQYRKLALLLHPDKNKSIGAEGAFKLISEAWSILSDKSLKAAYDAKRSSKVYQQKAKPPSESSPMPPGANGFHDFSRTATSNVKINKNTTSRTNGSSASGSTNKAQTTTFWTVCYICKIHYEYLRSYRNRAIRCPNCRNPFIAIETPPPAVRSTLKDQQKAHQEGRKKSSHNVGFNDTGNSQWAPFSGATGASSVAQAANVVQQTYEKVKRVREEAQAAKKREKIRKRKNHIPENVAGSSVEKKRKVSGEMGMNGYQVDPAAAELGSNPLRHGHSESIQTENIRKYNSTRVITHGELCNVLMHKGKTEICKKISEWKTVVGNAALKEKAVEEAHDKEERGKEYEENVDSHDPGSSQVVDLFSMPVPDPDFHDFDKDRTERAFGENQVWAVYDNNDGMPRYYAMIHRIISEDPFRVRVSWLNSKTDSDLGSVNWVGSWLSKTCGDFRTGRHETNDALNCFSHKVRWTKGALGAVHIFPRRGDVWALYRNWSRNWNELTEDGVIFKYDIVEVLNDYDEQLGVVVIPLVKVAGFKAVFHQHLNPKQARRIPRDEIFRFSHQVPSYLLSGREAPNAPKGCLELDPAALPLEFLKVIPDVNERYIEDNQETRPMEITDNTVKNPIDTGTMQNTEISKEEVNEKMGS